MSRSPNFSTAAAVRLCATLLGAASLAMPARAEGPLDAFLPKDGTITGHVVTFEVAASDRDISARFRRAVQGDMEWFKKAVRSNAPGQPLPYNEHMGITKEEYERLEHMTPAVKQGEMVSIAVARDGDGTLRLKPIGTGAAALDGISFPPGEKTALTPVGSLSIFNAIHQADPTQPLGVFEGAEWAQVEPADAEKPSAKLAFGRRTADGGGLLYYQVAPYKDHEERSLVVFYALK